MSIHYSEDYSYLEITDRETGKVEVAKDDTSKDDQSQSPVVPSEEYDTEDLDQASDISFEEYISEYVNPRLLMTPPPRNNIFRIRKLPPELQDMILHAIIEPLLNVPRIVEIHETNLQIRYTRPHNLRGSKNTVKLRHFRSKTPLPPIFYMSHQARDICLKFFDEECPLGNELCPDKVMFSFERDAAYFTQETLRKWMPFWRRCNSRNSEYPLNNDAGTELRTNLKRIVMDVNILVGTGKCTLPDGRSARGNNAALDELGPGLVAFPALEEITLVVSNRDARVHLGRLSMYEAGKIEDLDEAPWQALDADRWLSDINLVTPIPGSEADELLQEASDYLGDNLEYFFNVWKGLEGRSSLAYYKPPPADSVPVTRVRRQIPTIRIMVRDA